ncbi:MAG TPA: hypothetical protein VKA26_15335 [Ignavibacteriaceae bacterium]|nr:hypothetical protein [Ignavibacteriaceae bacterium]
MEANPEEIEQVPNEKDQFQKEISTEEDKSLSYFEPNLLGKIHIKELNLIIEEVKNFLR